jgi:tRNA U38,U39,U40 pseudouridine synthase TruA
MQNGILDEVRKAVERLSKNPSVENARCASDSLRIAWSYIYSVALAQGECSPDLIKTFSEALDEYARALSLVPPDQYIHRFAARTKWYRYLTDMLESSGTEAVRSCVRRESDELRFAQNLN